jgi:hypothetical protein
MGTMKSEKPKTDKNIQLAKARKPDVIWSHTEFGRELEKAKKMGRRRCRTTS